LVISDGDTRVEGEALVPDGDIDLLLGKDVLEKLGTRLKIGALPEIFIGEMPIGAIAEERPESVPKLRRQTGCWVPARSLKVVVIRPLKLTKYGDCVLVEPSEKLMVSKRLSTGKALLSTVGILKQIAITNLSEQQQWLEAGVVLGETNEIER
jgi:hypothetical protein